MATPVNTINNSSSAAYVQTQPNDDLTAQLREAENAGMQSIVSLLGSGQPVSPELFMQLLESRMNDIDGQVQTLMAGLETKTNDAKSLQDTIAKLTKLEAAMSNVSDDATKSLKLSEITIDGVPADQYIRDNNLGQYIQFDQAHASMPDQAVVGNTVETAEIDQELARGMLKSQKFWEATRPSTKKSSS
ncbi:MAG: hypothetical protein R3A47_02545 [Polyangiales bacterium]